MYKAFLIKYAEIAIKGKNRYMFEDALVNNIRYQLKNVDGNFSVRKETGRIYVEMDGDSGAIVRAVLVPQNVYDQHYQSSVVAGVQK